MKSLNQSQSYNQDEARVSREVYATYCFLFSQKEMAPTRRKDILRAAIGSTQWGVLFGGRISKKALAQIEDAVRLKQYKTACFNLQRDHLFTWKETEHLLFASNKKMMSESAFCTYIKKRNEVTLITKIEHTAVGKQQKSGKSGEEAYRLAKVELTAVDPKAVKASGFRPALVLEYWQTRQNQRQAI